MDICNRFNVACSIMLLLLSSCASVSHRRANAESGMFVQWGQNGKQQHTAVLSQHKNCSNWAVTLSTAGPTKSVRSVALLDKSWCLIVVTGPTALLNEWQSLLRSDTLYADRVILLSLQLQEDLFKDSFFRYQLPEKHIARKNLGYLLAIRHGAGLVFDFDEIIEVCASTMGSEVPFTAGIGGLQTPAAASANFANRARSNGAGSLFLDRAHICVYDREQPSSARLGSGLVINPYTAMGVSKALAWPRGIPYNDALDLRSKPQLVGLREDTYPETISVPSSMLRHASRASLSEVGVIQSTIQNDPNEAAISKLSTHTRLSFRPLVPSIIVPQGSFAPFNAAATLYTRQALWALLLPTTVNSKVSDVWRSYAAQRIFWDIGLQLSFVDGGMAVSFATQRQTFRSETKDDLRAEMPLNLQTEELLRLLSHWTCTASRLSITSCMGQLWKMMHTHGFVEQADVDLLRMWLEELKKIGYSFPRYRKQGQRLQQEVERTRVGQTLPASSESRQPSCVEDTTGPQVTSYFKRLSHTSTPTLLKLLCHGSKVPSAPRDKYNSVGICSSCTRPPQGFLPTRLPPGINSLLKKPPDRALVVRMDYSPGLGNLFMCLVSHFSTAMLLSREVVFVRDKAPEGQVGLHLLELMMETYAALRLRDVTDASWWSRMAPNVNAGTHMDADWIRSSRRFVLAPAFCNHKPHLAGYASALELASRIDASQKLRGPSGRPYCMLTLPPKFVLLRRSRTDGSDSASACIAASLFGTGPDPRSTVGMQLKTYLRDVARIVDVESDGNAAGRGGDDDGSSDYYLPGHANRTILLAVHVRVGDMHAFAEAGGDSRLQGEIASFPWDTYFQCVWRIALRNLASAGFTMPNLTTRQPVLLPWVHLRWYIATDWSLHGSTTRTALWKAAEHILDNRACHSILLPPVAGGAIHTASNVPTNLSTADFRRGVQRVLLEHALLSRADYLFHTPSSFSGSAAAISLRPSVVVDLMEASGRTGTCTQ